MVVLSSGMLTSVPRYRKLAEPSDHVRDLDRLSVAVLLLRLKRGQKH
jgi:hypothetical protein